MLINIYNPRINMELYSYMVAENKSVPEPLYSRAAFCLEVPFHSEVLVLSVYNILFFKIGF